MTRKSLALWSVAREHVVRYSGPIEDWRRHVNGVTAGYGKSEGAALTDAIARGNLSPTTLDAVRNEGQVEFWHTPFGVVLTNQG